MRYWKRLKTLWSDCRVINKLLLCYLLTILLPLSIVFTVFMTSMGNAFTREYELEKERVLQQAANAFDSARAQARYATSTLEGSKELVRYFTGSYRTASDEVYAILRDINPMFLRLTASSGILIEVKAYRYCTSFIRATPHIKSASVSEYGEDRLRSLGSGENLVEVRTEDGAVHLVVVTPLFKDGVVSNIGVCRSVLDITQLIENISLLPSESFVLQVGEIFLCRSAGDGAVRAISQEEFLAMPGSRISVRAEGLEDFSLHFVSEKALLKNAEIRWILISFALSLGLLTLIYYAIPIMLVRPIVRLSQHMNEGVDNGGIRPLVLHHGKDEIGDLIESFNRLVILNAELNARVLRELEMRQQSEYYALQSQIKPHFVFNVLQKVNMMVFLDQKAEASSLLQRFGAFLRYSIRRQANSSTLDGEIVHVRNYLEMLQSAGQSQLSLLVEEEINTIEVKCPQFILQPIAENAVKYNSPNGVQLVLRIWEEGDFIITEMRNDGAPVPEEILQGIRKRMREDEMEIQVEEGEYPSGIGLVNVHMRLRYFYGKECGLDIENIEDGVAVRLRMRRQPVEGASG